jgi:ubiquinol-cytochrome c reductase cytochrome b subunit
MPKNFKSIQNHISNIPIPSSINYNWNIGSLLGITLGIQILTGLIISFHYVSSVEEAFQRVIRISRNVNNGWLIRAIHINGASLFFILIYSHISKNILINSFKLKITWNIGVIIVLLLIATAFMGYVLPWGQISFWAATVITNLISAIPIWGDIIVKWLWGGFSVRAPTLTRFFSFHFILPFIIAALAISHLISLHSTGSSNPIRIQINKDKINFHPFFTRKDIVGTIFILLLTIILILIRPYTSTDPENFIPANPIVTPVHIQPEWYFLFAYAILRSIPNKLGGVIALAIRILILIIKTIQNSPKTSFKFNSKRTILFSILIHIFLILTWIGIKQVEEPFILIGSIYRFLYFFIVILI